MTRIFFGLLTILYHILSEILSGDGRSPNIFQFIAAVAHPADFPQKLKFCCIMRIFVWPGSSKGSSLTQKGRVLKLDLGNPFKVAITREEDLPPPADTHFYTLLCDGCKCCTTATSSIVCTNNAPESRT